MLHRSSPPHSPENMTRSGCGELRCGGGGCGVLRCGGGGCEGGEWLDIDMHVLAVHTYVHLCTSKLKDGIIDSTDTYLDISNPTPSNYV